MSRAIVEEFLLIRRTPKDSTAEILLLTLARRGHLKISGSYASEALILLWGIVNATGPLVLIKKVGSCPRAPEWILWLLMQCALTGHQWGLRPETHHGRGTE